MNKIKVLSATKKHIPFLIVMTNNFYDTTELKKIKPFSMDDMNHLLHELIERDDAECFIVVEDKIPIGTIGVFTMRPLVAPGVKMANEVFWWVEPKYRNIGAGKKLLKRAEQWAKDKECDALNFMAIAGDENKKSSEVYKKAGFDLCENNFWKVF